MAGFERDVMLATNMNFDEAAPKPHLGILNTGGKLAIGTGQISPIPEILGGNIVSPNNTILIGYSSPNITVATNGSSVLNTLTPDLDFDGSAATPISPQAGNINIFGVNPSFATVTDTLNSTGTAAGNLQVEHRAWQTGFVVDASATPGTRGTFTTIQAAITAAVAGQTVFIRPSTTPYTENLTLKVGVNLAAFTGDGGSGTVTIIGTATLTTAGTVAISGIRLQTDGAFLLAVTGTAASVVKLYNCFLNITDNTGISFTSSDAGSSIMVIDCWGNIGTTGITTYAHSGAGNLRFQNTTIENSGGSTTASTVSGAGSVQYLGSFLSFITTTSSTSSYLSLYCQQGAANSVALTCGGTGNNNTTGSLYSSGTAAAISVGASSTLNCNNININSTNANPITGAGTVVFNEIAWQDTGNTINTTTVVPRATTIGTLRLPYQPCVLAYVNASTTNQTGNGANYTVIFNSEVYDLAGNYNTGTGTFTAPITGRYKYDAKVIANGLTASHTAVQFSIVATSRTVDGARFNIGAIRDAGNNCTVQNNGYIDMTANDTFTVVLNVSGGTQVVGAVGGAASTLLSYLAVELLS